MSIIPGLQYRGGENAVSQKITEETGVNINFITPIGNETEN